MRMWWRGPVFRQGSWPNRSRLASQFVVIGSRLLGPVLVSPSLLRQYRYFEYAGSFCDLRPWGLLSQEPRLWQELSETWQTQMLRWYPRTCSEFFGAGPGRILPVLARETWDHTELEGVLWPVGEYRLGPESEAERWIPGIMAGVCLRGPGEGSLFLRTTSLVDVHICGWPAVRVAADQVERLRVYQAETLSIWATKVAHSAVELGRVERLVVRTSVPSQLLDTEHGPRCV